VPKGVIGKYPRFAGADPAVSLLHRETPTVQWVERLRRVASYPIGVVIMEGDMVY
jgi:hypothetical protein